MEELYSLDEDSLDSLRWVLGTRTPAAAAHRRRAAPVHGLPAGLAGRVLGLGVAAHYAGSTIFIVIRSFQQAHLRTDFPVQVAEGGG